MTHIENTGLECGDLAYEASCGGQDAQPGIGSALPWLHVIKYKIELNDITFYNHQEVSTKNIVSGKTLFPLS